MTPTQNIVATGVMVGVAPGASRSLRVDLDFASEAVQELDLTTQAMNGMIAGVQGVFVDNRSSGDTLYIECVETGHAQEVPAASQGWLILLATNMPRFKLECAGGGTARLHFVNYPVSPDIWS